MVAASAIRADAAPRLTPNDEPMRPEVLFPAFQPVTRLAGVGPKIARLIARIAGERVVDLYWHLPTGVIDRRPIAALGGATPGEIATVQVQVTQHQPPARQRQPYRVLCRDADGAELTLVFFHARPDYLTRLLPEGEMRIVSGRIELYDDRLQLSHPDHVVTPEEADQIPETEPVYPLTTGLTPKPLAKAIRAALQTAPDLAEWQDAAWLARQDWPAWRPALLAAHAPAGAADTLPGAPARRRLAYDELLANQLALGAMRRALRRRAGRGLAGDGHLRAKVEAALPYRLTAAQRQAGDEILADMAADGRMLRLLQGDVGSGKTVVALLALLNAVECGTQGALMAPTELLERQHFATLAPLCRAAGVRLALLTGRDKGKARAELVAAVAAGEVAILVGTHALFQHQVAFRDLGAVVIDEQHRFGVHQRLAMSAKADGAAADVLVMTATPIPRTLTLTAYGDMEVSRLTEKPPGRQPIATRVLPLERLAEVVGAIARKITRDERVYWVCPLVEESAASDQAAAEARYGALSQRFGDAVALVHGRLKPAEKDKAMARFAAGEARILVATTVVEVGVDVPEATVMVVEGAERFGLAQLHQLRGRVGRGREPGTCLLLYGPPLNQTARARLRILRETDDGFLIAEEDLRLRGAGDLLGTQQSGLPVFRIADLVAHADLLAVARDDARLILTRDPELKTERGRQLRVLLYLFERDAAVRNLTSG